MAQHGHLSLGARASALALALALPLALPVQGGLHAAEPGHRLALPMSTSASAPPPAFVMPRLLRVPQATTSLPTPSTAPMPLQPSAQPPTAAAVAQPWQMGRLAPARLAFGVPVPDQKKPAWGGVELRFDAATAQPFVVWEAADAAAYQWRWQVAAQPFAAASSHVGVLAEGDAGPGYARLDLRGFVPSPQARAQRASGQEPPVLHIRVAAFKNGQPAGRTTNTVVARYDAGVQAAAQQQIKAGIADAAQQKQKSEALLAQVQQTFDLKIVGFKPAVFPDPNRWGCVVVLANPYAGKLHPLGAYAKGKEYCPPVDPATQQKSTADWVVLGVTSYIKVWDGLAGVFNGSKQWLAKQFAGLVPCESLGKKAGQNCHDAMQELAGHALSAGLVAAGLPPSLPDTAALSAAAKGKVADAAAEFTCDGIEAQGGSCPPALRAELRKRYAQALDELHKALVKGERRSREPACGDAQTAKEHGLKPLPCFAEFPGTDLRPAAGAVYVPPRVTLVVARKTATVPGVAGCNSVAVGTMLSNRFKGGYLAGKNLPAADVAGAPYETATVGLPHLAVGQSRQFEIDLHPMAAVQVPGNPWPGFYFPNWRVLYWGGKGSVDATIAASVDTGPHGRVAGYCGVSGKWPLQIAP